MPRKTILRGTEEDTLEIEGDLPDGTRVGVLFFAMRGLRFKGAVADIEILSDTLSEPTFGARVKWSRGGLVHRGRIHMCGFASEIRTATRHPV